jgi:inosose dehydratase
MPRLPSSARKLQSAQIRAERQIEPRSQWEGARFSRDHLRNWPLNIKLRIFENAESSALPWYHPANFAPSHRAEMEGQMNLSRRELLLGSAAGLFALPATAAPRPSHSRISVEGYIWQQYMSGKKENLAEGLDEIFAMARSAGFHNIELSTGFLTPELRGPVIDHIQKNDLWMPSVYVGGAMHQESLADATAQHSLEIARFCKTVGCHAIVGDPSPKQGQVPKTDAELATQAAMLNKLGKALAAEGFEFWVHNHDAEMVSNAKEWWSNLNATDPNYVRMCIDIDWVHQGGQDPMALLRAAGKRVACLHLRNSKDKLWLEALTDGDIDYRKIAEYLKTEKLEPLLMVELAYRPDTLVTRPLEQDLQLSRVYAEQIFKVKA